MSPTIRPSPPASRWSSIDAASYDATLAGQQATVTARQADIEAAQRQVAQQQASRRTGQCATEGCGGDRRLRRREAERYRVLSGKGVETEQRYAQAVNRAMTRPTPPC